MKMIESTNLKKKYEVNIHLCFLLTGLKLTLTKGILMLENLVIPPVRREFV